MVEITEEGVVGGDIKPPRSITELKTLAIDFVEGRAFATWMLRKHEMNLLKSVFMPLMFMDDLGLAQLRSKGIVHFYGMMKDAMPRSINGLPCFMSLGMLTEEETTIIHEQIDKYIKINEEFMKE